MTDRAVTEMMWDGSEDDRELVIVDEVGDQVRVATLETGRCYRITVEEVTDHD